MNSNTKKIRSRKNKDKDRKALYKLMDNAIYRKTMENMRNRIDVKLVNNEKSYLKYTSNPSYISRKIFGNNLVAIRNTKVALKLNKPAFIRMCIKQLSKILLHEFLYDYIKIIYDNKSKLWFTNFDSLMYKSKTEDCTKILGAIRKNLILVTIRLNQTNYDDSKELVIGKMRNETVSFAIE